MTQPNVLLSATTEYVAAFKAAKKFTAEHPWCCSFHRAIAEIAMKVFSDLKNKGYEEFKTGKMDEKDFIEFVQEGTKTVLWFIDDQKRRQHDVEIESQINVATPKRVYEC